LQATVSQEALTHYHRGRHFTSLWTEEGIHRGIEHFEQAIALDSNFALAYAGLAEALTMQGEGPGDIRPVEYMPRVRGLVLQALDLDPELADAHRMLGYISYMYDYDYEAGERETRLATELDPTSAEAWEFYGLALSAMGRDEEAIVAGRRSVELDPVAPFILSDFGLILILARRYEEALQMWTTAIELDPDFYWAYANAGEASSLLGDHDEAIRLYQQVLARAGEESPLFLGMFGSIHGFAGNTEEALRILDELLEMREQRYVAPRVLAAVYLGLDSLDAAMDWYILAAEMRDPGVNFYDIRSPFVDKLREHPRYPEWLRLMRLEPSADGD
jgi:serine/threonine-protein kinase